MIGDRFDDDVISPTSEAPSALPRLFFDRQGSSRVPHLGHAILFASFAGLVLLLLQLLLLTPAHAQHGAHIDLQSAIEPKRLLGSMALTYFATLATGVLVFPLFWHRSFFSGINWNGAEARRLATRLIPLGLGVGVTVQAISSLLPMPKTLPMDDFFRTRSDVWLITAFGTLLAPLFEEIAFRGFLLPAVAIAFDWLAAMLRYLSAFTGARFRRQEPPRYIAIFPEDAAAGLSPDTGNLFFRSPTAIVTASLVSSLLFARLHAEQLAHAWAGLAVLFCVSLVLTVVRVRTRSVACSTIVHSCYNLSVFITLFLATGGYRHLERMSK